MKKNFIVFLTSLLLLSCVMKDLEDSAPQPPPPVVKDTSSINIEIDWSGINDNVDTLYFVLNSDTTIVKKGTQLPVMQKDSGTYKMLIHNKPKYFSFKKNVASIDTASNSLFFNFPNNLYSDYKEVKVKGETHITLKPMPKIHQLKLDIQVRTIDSLYATDSSSYLQYELTNVTRSYSMATNTWSDSSAVRTTTKNKQITLNLLGVLEDEPKILTLEVGSNRRIFSFNLNNKLVGFNEATEPTIIKVE